MTDANDESGAPARTEVCAHLFFLKLFFIV